MVLGILKKQWRLRFLDLDGGIFSTVKIFLFQMSKFSFFKCQNFPFSNVKIFLFQMSKFSFPNVNKKTNKKPLFKYARNLKIPATPSNFEPKFLTKKR
jgi:hypothetical protein